MAEALITPQILRWARARAQLPAGDVAKAAGVDVDKFLGWERGDSKPTLRQAQRVANKLNIPFGYLYLSEPPMLDAPLTDFRKLPNAEQFAMSTDLYDLLQQTVRKQEWYSDYLITQDADRLTYVSSFDIQDDLHDVAEDIVLQIGIDDALRNEARDHAHFIRLLIENCTNSGITVLRTSVVGNNNNRGISVDEFRGFAISDPFAPFILINSKDAKAAQVFTILHELAHIWIGESGISNPRITAEVSPQKQEVTSTKYETVESFCNAVAAQVLVPESNFVAYWNTLNRPVEQLTEIARRYWVSAIVILRRALDLQLIDRETFFKHYDRVSVWHPTPSSVGNDGHFYNTFFARHHKSLTRSIINAVYEGDLLYRDAANLLGIKVKTISKLAKEMEIA